MQIENIKIRGMSCEGCVKKVLQALQAVPGVNDVTVSLSDSDANVQYDEEKTSVEQLKAAVKDAGYDVDPTNITAGLTLKNDS